MNIEEIRKDFPILKRKINGKQLVYLDNAATTQKPKQVIDAMTYYYENTNANIHRGLHTLAEESTQQYEEAHAAAAQFIKAKAEEIIFTKNATESLNLVAYSMRKQLQKGDEILLTELEHHANLVPWQMIAQETGAKLKFIPTNEEGMLALEKLDELVNEKTKIVSFTHASNVLGSITDVKTIVSKAKEVNAITIVDAAQSAPNMQLDVKALDVDFLAFSGHKMLGPTGIGILYGKRERLEALPPFLGGGEMIHEVWFDHATYNTIPWKFEAGTPPIAEGIGLHAAINYLNTVGINTILRHEQQLVKQAIEGLKEIEGVTLYGPVPEKRTGVLSFNIQGVHPHDIAGILDQESIAIRAGSHCAQPLLRKMCIDSTARASFYLYNNEEEVTAFIGAVKKVQKVFG